MLTLATTFLLLSTAAKPGPQPGSDPLPDAPSAQLQQQQPAPASPPVQPPDHPRPSPQWLKVEALQPGDSIAVLEPSRRFPAPCRFDDVTDDTLTCIVDPPGSAPRRTVYPIHNIEAVYTEEWTTSPSKAGLIAGSGLGGFLMGALCSQASAGIITTCVFVGAAIGAGVALVPAPYPIPARPHLRRRLIYHAP
jgi:hypothetical protein